MPPPTSRSERGVSINGPALRAIRQLLNVDVQDLAAALQCDRSYFSHLETGSRRRCSPLFLSQLCDTLGIRDRRVLLACPYGEHAHEEHAPDHDALADTVELERPEVGGELPRIVAVPRIPAPELVPEPRQRRNTRATARHRAKTSPR